jgi:putative DNA primase/helicase
MLPELEKLCDIGYHLIPIKPSAKIPLIAKWTERASRDTRIISSWYESYPNCNWGIVTGQISNIVVFDIDPRHGGDISWKKLITPYEPIAPTTTCKTGGGGFHYYYQLDREVGNRQLSAYPGVDIRANGGQVLIPPSINGTGGKYTWVHAPWEVTPISLPAWLSNLLFTPDNKEDTPNYPTLGSDILPGQRNNSFYKHALMLARQGAAFEFVLSTITAWKEVLGEEARDISEEEISRTVTSAFNTIEKEREKGKGSGVILKTDSDNASRLVKLYSDTIRYAGGVGWLIWDGCVWGQDEDDAQITNKAVQSMVILRDESLEKIKTPGQFKEAVTEVAWATSSLNIGKLSAAVKLASTTPSVRLSVNQLDDDRGKFVLNTPSGIVDLRTGVLSPHNPSALITRITNTRYNPEATCPFWLSTLQLIFEEELELVEYMQRALGYTLTGSTAEQCIFLCWGEQGNNGKSTVLETVMSLLGTYAQMSDIKVITSADMDNRVSSSLAKLRGTRAVFMNEAEDNQRFSEALIKQLTGGDTLQACKKFKEPFEYKPAFKLWIRTNEKPQIRGTSDAIWRRIKLIPFNRSIPVSLRLSRDIVDDKLKEEHEGILNWLIQGAMKWCAEGMENTKIINASVQEYRSEMDVINQFIDECVVIKTLTTTPKIDLYQAFSRWCKNNGIKYSMTSDKFNRRIGLRVGKQDRVMVKGQYVWQGLELSEYAKGLLYL